MNNNMSFILPPMIYGSKDKTHTKPNISIIHSQ
jgi:hypothetical protein